MPRINLKKNRQRIAVINEQRYVTRVDRYSTISEKEVVAYAAQSAHVPASSITNATMAIRQAIEYFVINGHHVNLGKFGFLGIGIKAKSAYTKQDVSADLIDRLYLRYRPSTEVKELLGSVELKTV